MLTEWFFLAFALWARLWGHEDCLQANVRILVQYDVLFSRIPLVGDVQAAWSPLLRCAGARGNYLLRVVRLEKECHFTEGHNRGLRARHHNKAVVHGRHVHEKCNAHRPASTLGKLGKLPRSDHGARHPDVAALIVQMMRGSRCSSYAGGCGDSGEGFVSGGLFWENTRQRSAFSRPRAR